MEKRKYYAHNFLISLKNNSVVYVYQHNAEGASGIIINHESESKLSEIMDQLDIKYNPPIGSHQVLIGGPVNPENGFIIYPDKNATSIPQAQNNQQKNLDPLIVSSSRNTLESIAKGQGPSKFIIALGYSSWEAGQLEMEMQKNTWLLSPYDEEVLFDAPLHKKRQLASFFSLHKLSTLVGHG